MTWLHGRARTLAENVLTLSARGGRWGWLPPWASQDPKGRVRGRELQPEGPSHPAGTWPTSLPFCCPDQNCCPPPPIAWWLKGKKSVCKGSSPCLSWGPCFTSCSKENQENGQQNECLSQDALELHPQGQGPEGGCVPSKVTPLRSSSHTSSQEKWSHIFRRSHVFVWI